MSLPFQKNGWFGELIYSLFRRADPFACGLALKKSARQLPLGSAHREIVKLTRSKPALLTIQVGLERPAQVSSLETSHRNPMSGHGMFQSQ